MQAGKPGRSRLGRTNSFRERLRRADRAKVMVRRHVGDGSVQHHTGQCRMQVMMRCKEMKRGGAWKEVRGRWRARANARTSRVRVAEIRAGNAQEGGKGLRTRQGQGGAALTEAAGALGCLMCA